MNNSHTQHIRKRKTMNKKSNKSYKSLIYNSEQRIIKESIDKLYDYCGDEVFLSLKSEDEVERMKMRSLSVLNDSKYMSLSEQQVEESYEGIREKLLINGHYKEQ